MERFLGGHAGHLPSVTGNGITLKLQHYWRSAPP